MLAKRVVNNARIFPQAKALEYNPTMDAISPEIEKELERRLAEGPFRSVDELLRQALNALDGAREAAQELFELELLKGLEGEDVEMTAADWDHIEQQASRVLESKNVR